MYFILFINETNNFDPNMQNQNEEKYFWQTMYVCIF